MTFFFLFTAILRNPFLQVHCGGCNTGCKGIGGVESRWGMQLKYRLFHRSIDNYRSSIKGVGITLIMSEAAKERAATKGSEGARTGASGWLVEADHHKAVICIAHTPLMLIYNLQMTRRWQLITPTSTDTISAATFIILLSASTRHLMQLLSPFFLWLLMLLSKIWLSVLSWPTKTAWLDERCLRFGIRLSSYSNGMTLTTETWPLYNAVSFSLTHIFSVFISFLTIYQSLSLFLSVFLSINS